MMPDKIYLNNYMLRKGMMYPAQPPADVPEEEYIRKNALLEWASNMLGKVSDMGFDDGDVEHGYTRALQDIIDKINSM